MKTCSRALRTSDWGKGSPSNMIMHGPMSQGSVHNSWKLKMSQFFHTHQTSPIEHVWDALDWRVRQCVPVLANIQQLCTVIEEEWDNIPQATINTQISCMRRRCVALHTRYWLVFWSTPLTFFLKVSVTNRCISVFPVMWKIRAKWIYCNLLSCNSVKYLKLLHVAFYVKCRY